MLRTRIQNIGGPFPGVGSAPTMVHDKWLPRSGRAAFERLNDEASMRPHVFDAGSMVAVNDNVFGFAPGNYMCKCCTCGRAFSGAKRSWCCQPCSNLKINEESAA